MDDRSIEINNVPFLIEQQEDLEIWVINQEFGELELTFAPLSCMSASSYVVRTIADAIGSLDREEHGWVYYRKPLQSRTPLLVESLPDAIELVARYELDQRKTA